MKLDLLISATVIDDAMRFAFSNNTNKKSVSRKEDNNSKESKESDYDEKDSSDKRYEEKKEKQTEEILTETINQIF